MEIRKTIVYSTHLTEKEIETIIHALKIHRDSSSSESEKETASELYEKFCAGR